MIFYDNISLNIEKPFIIREYLMLYRSQLLDLLERLSVNTKLSDKQRTNLFYMIDHWEKREWTYGDLEMALNGKEVTK